MKKLWMVLALWGALAAQLHAQWKPVEGRIRTQWSEQVNPDNVLPEYPRPIMERTEWKNLNGLWDYAIIDKGGRIPTDFEGQILVPFAVESSLSGVGKTVGERKIRKWSIVGRFDDSFCLERENRYLLHFGAVDWKTDVWVNDIKVGSHTGGFTPFSFDITPALSAKGITTRLVVKVWDPTDKRPLNHVVSKYQQTGRYLVHSCNRYLANCMAGTCQLVIVYSGSCVLLRTLIIPCSSVEGLGKS